jgi:hypothetical protein
VIAGYETVRAGALDAAGETVPPGGAGMIVQAGVPAWLATWTVPPPLVAARSVPSTDLPTIVSALQPDLVLILASMVLGHVPAVQP